MQFFLYKKHCIRNCLEHIPLSKGFIKVHVSLEGILQNIFLIWGIEELRKFLPCFGDSLVKWTLNLRKMRKTIFLIFLKLRVHLRKRSPYSVPNYVHIGELWEFRKMSNFKIRKIEISRDSGGVRSSALDMFYTKDSTFDFLRRKKMFRFFFIEKKIWRTKISDFALTKNNCKGEIFEEISKVTNFKKFRLAWYLTDFDNFLCKTKFKISSLQENQVWNDSEL